MQCRERPLSNDTKPLVDPCLEKTYGSGRRTEGEALVKVGLVENRKQRGIFFPIVCILEIATVCKL